MPLTSTEKPRVAKLKGAPACPECQNTHYAGVACPPPAEPDREWRIAPRTEAHRVQFLEARIAGIDEILRDIKYNADFGMRFRNAAASLRNLRAAYEEERAYAQAAVEETRAS